ncbi:MAG: hypothetical protein ACTHQM_00690 [Thermoanaerobaculia bacterium]
MTLGPQQTIRDHVDRCFCARFHRRPRDPLVFALRDLERDDAVDAAPDCLRDEIDVVQAVARFALRDEVGDDALQKRVRVFRRISLVLEIADRVLRRHEHEPVVARILEAESDVRVACGTKALHGIFDFRDLREAVGELLEIAVAELGEERVFVFEVEVNRGRGVLDPIGDAAHRDRVNSFIRKEFARRIENPGADFLTFALSTFLWSQNVPPLLNAVKLGSEVRFVKGERRFFCWRGCALWDGVVAETSDERCDE